MFSPAALCTCTGARDESFSGALSLGVGLWAALVSSGRCAVGEASVLAGPGDLFLANGPLTLHAPLPCHLMALALEGTAAEQVRAALSTPLLLPGSACPLSSDRVSQLLSGGLSPGRTSAQTYALLCELWEARETAHAPTPLTAQAIALMREHYATLYGVEELADQLGVSKSHLIRQFSAAVGIPPGQYLTQVRLSAAKELLLCREYTLETIAGLCGFSGANYFCRVFRRTEGLSPTAWVRANGHRPPPGDLSQFIKII